MDYEVENQEKKVNHSEPLPDSIDKDQMDRRKHACSSSRVTDCPESG